MKPINVTFEVQQDGQKSRLFRFAEPEITIGFSAGCNLALEPLANPGAELAVLTQSEPCLLRAKSKPGTFSLNGTPCVTDMPVKSGDEITGGSYRIVIRNLPEPAAVVPPAVSEPEDEALTKAAGKKTGGIRCSAAKKGRAFLSLFVFCTGSGVFVR
jgi:hypothetical protein